MNTVLTSEIVNVTTADGAKTVTFSTLDPLIELLMFNATVDVQKVVVSMTRLSKDKDKVIWSGPALCGLLPRGYVDKKKGTGAWTKTNAAKLNGLEVVPIPGDAASQTLIMEFQPKDGKIFSMNEKVEPMLVFALPHVSKVTGTTDDPVVYAILCSIHVKIG